MSANEQVVLCGLNELALGVLAELCGWEMTSSWSPRSVDPGLARRARLSDVLHRWHSASRALGVDLVEPSGGVPVAAWSGVLEWSRVASKVKGRTKLLLIAFAVGVGLLILSSLRGGSDLEFVAPAGERSVVDLGPRGASLGDVTVVSGPLQDGDGDPAGRHDGTCTLTSRPDDEEQHRVRCAVTLTVGTENGETELQLAAVGRVAADDVLFSVVGGSGKYRNARGDALFDYTDPDRTRITVDLED